MSAENSYLDRLVVDAKLKIGIVASYLSNFRLTILLILTIIVGGTISYFNIPQRLNPQINIPIVSIVTILPGASPQDIESLITIPVEDSISTIDRIDTITSTSRENMSIVTVQFTSGINPKSAEQEIQSAVNKITNLPEDAIDPSVKAFDFEDTPIWTFALSTNENIPSLMRFADRLETAIKKSDKVDRVTMSGFEEQEIQIVIQPEKLRQFGLNPIQLGQTIKKLASSYPAGNINTDKNTVSLTINPRITTINDLRTIRITVQGKIVQLGDISEITQRSKDNQTKSFLATQEKEASRVVTFFVYKTQSADINQASDEVRKIVAETLDKSNGKFKETTILNTSDEIRTQFNDLIHEFSITIVLVFLCLFTFIGLRQALISSITIPLTFLASFIFMPMFGISINFLTLFAFLLSLGLLIDDTIVIVSAMTTYYRSGKFTIQETGLLVWKDFIVPIWSTTLTTIWAFVPLLLATGIIGEFIKPIPIVISLVMISSTAIAVLVTLPLMMIILKPQFPSRVITLFRIIFFIVAISIIVALAPKNILLPLVILSYFIVLYILIKIRGNIKQSTKNIISNNTSLQYITNLAKKYVDKPILNIEVISSAYKKIIFKILDSKKARIQVIAAIIIFSVVSYALVPLGLVKNEFFPMTDAQNIYINIEFPSGTNLETITAESTEVLNKLRKTKDTKFISADIGREAGNSSMSPGNGQSTVAYTLHLIDAHNRKRTSMEIAETLRKEYKSYSKGKLSVIEESGGPPAGADLQIELSGDDLSTTDSYAQKIMEYLKKRPGVNNISSSLKPGTSQIVFVPNEDELAKNNITIDTIGYYMRLFANGFEMDSIKFEGNSNEQERVLLKLGYNNQEVTDLGRITIPTQTGTSLPIESLGKFETQQSPTQITRSERKRTITVSAGVDVTKTNITEEGTQLENFANTLQLPDGYSWKTGGVNEENSKSIQSIIQAMGVAFVLILLTMVIQFGSFRQAFIALIVIPLAVSAVFFVFALTGTPLSFPALIGILALFGIIVTNSMFIIDKINLNQREGMAFKEAIADAGSSRLEPIVLTKLSTVLGLLPITLAEPLWRGLGGAIIAGVLLASTFMLFFIPVVYYSFFINDEKIK